MKKALFLLFIFNLFFLNAQLNNSLIVHYNLDGNSNDASVNQLNGTINGAVSTYDRNSVLNKAMYFDGTDDNIDIPHSDIIKAQFPITISFWLNMSETAEGALFHSDYNTNQYYGYWVSLTIDQKIRLNFGSGGIAGSGSRRTKKSAQSITPGTWQHIVCIIRSYNDMDIYIDCQNAGGSYEGGGNTAIAYSNSHGSIFSTFSQGGNPPIYLKGKMDDLRVWGRELSINEITGFCNEIIPNQESLPNIQSICEPVTLIAPTATDLMGNQIVGVSNTSFPITNSGLTIVTWSYTDLNGNVVTQDQTVSIESDLSVSILQNQNILSSNLDADSYKWIDCSTGNEILNATNHDFTPVYTGDYKLIVNSGICNDTSECFSYKAVSANNESLEMVESICQPITLTSPFATDVMGNNIVGVSNTSFPIANIGLTFVTWTYTDINGNVLTQNQEVNLIENDLNVGILQNENVLYSTLDADSYKWIDCSTGSEISNETNHDFTPLISGEYKLIVNSGICNDTSECFTYNLLNLEKNTLIFEVYPNPVKDYLIIKNNKSENLTFVIYDELGKSIKNDKLINNKIDFRNLSNGIYILKIFDKENEISKLKIIKN
ncbi:MAG: LamG-like jellyroll fold domain-containing protein [Bacteroidota bacterium]